MLPNIKLSPKRCLTKELEGRKEGKKEGSWEDA